VVGREEFPAPSGRSWVNDMPCQPRRSDTVFRSARAPSPCGSSRRIGPRGRLCGRSQVGHPPSARIWAIDRRAR
jgi:hypothetical protein